VSLFGDSYTSVCNQELSSTGHNYCAELPTLTCHKSISVNPYEVTLTICFVGDFLDFLQNFSEWHSTCFIDRGSFVLVIFSVWWCQDCECFHGDLMFDLASWFDEDVSRRIHQSPKASNKQITLVDLIST
jgi:hypothetical protein